VCGGQSSCRGGGPMKRDVAHVRETRRQPGPAPVDATTRHGHGWGTVAPTHP
jgi:hypothetical protein